MTPSRFTIFVNHRCGANAGSNVVRGALRQGAALASALLVAAALVGAPMPAAAQSAGTKDAPWSTDRYRSITVDDIRKMLGQAKGIGIFSKLRLEIKINKFTEDFYWFHKGQSTWTLGRLRARFEGLHQTIINMLSEDNPRLTAKFLAARGSLWFAYRDSNAFSGGIGKNVAARIEGDSANLKSN